VKSNKIALVALLLWVVTLAAFAWFFIHGSTSAGSDGRTAIVLQPAERDLVLSEMRGLLSSTQGILEGANKGDVKLIIQHRTVLAWPPLQMSIQHSWQNCRWNSNCWAWAFTTTWIT